MPALNLVINSQCTCRCQWCDLWRSGAPEMPWETIAAVAALCRAAGIRLVMITGGEPSLHSRFLDVLRLFHSAGCSIVLCTDGLSLAPRLAQAVPLVDSYLISLDAHEPRLYRRIRGVDGYHTVAGLPHRIKAMRPDANLQISHLLQPQNAAHLRSFYLRVRQLPVDGLSIVVPDAFSPAFGHEGGARPALLAAMRRLDVAAVGGELLAVHRLDRASPQPIIGQTEEAMWHYIAYLSSWQARGQPDVPRLCTIPDNTITIDLDGRVRPCFYLPYDCGPLDGDWVQGRARFLQHPDRMQQGRELGCSRCAQFMC